ncbi:hypothetical protein ACFRAQ_34630 [Nocardia sp. NPDC056611]|uniref:hypothetical protein n=1 Tax=Nocardia sp. NPDC056611 TaxID=3345877 RepID=UPI0036717B34
MALTPAMEKIAKDVVMGYLDSELEFCMVGERGDIDDFTPTEIVEIYNEAARQLGAVADLFMGREF